MNARSITTMTLVGLLGVASASCGYELYDPCDSGAAGDPSCAPSDVPEVRVVALAAGDEHTCAISEAGELRCWGSGRYGRLGYGDMGWPSCTVNTGDFTCAASWRCCVGDDERPSSETPLFLSGAAVEVSAGGEHTCAIIDGGELRCWGRNTAGQLGLAEGPLFSVGDDEPPTSIAIVELGGPALHVAAGGEHTCALLAGGALRCWGSNELGRLGHGDTDAATCDYFGDYKCFEDPACCVGDDELPSARDPVALGGPATSVSAAALHSCAVLEGGELRCWGDNSFGQLGYGSAGAQCLGADMQHSCDADPSCCVGDDETPAEAGPVSVGGAVVQVSTGGAYFSTGERAASHTCAVLEGGALRCWGDNSYGQLGYGHTNRIGDDELPSDVGPVDVGGPVRQVAVGASHTCALLEGGDVRCWGENFRGQLGLGHTLAVGEGEVPAAVEPVNIGGPATQIVVGGGPPFWPGGSPRFGHACALMENGATRCWGGGTVNSGQLGYGDVGGTRCLLNAQVATSFSCSIAPACCIGDEPGDMPPAIVDAFDD